MNRGCIIFPRTHLQYSQCHNISRIWPAVLPVVHRFINAAPEQVHKGYKQLQRELTNAEKGFRDDMTKVYQEACRRRIHNDELERQLSGMAVEETVEPSIRHHLEERTQVSSILCDFKLTRAYKKLQTEKSCVINLLVIAGRREQQLGELS